MQNNKQEVVITNFDLKYMDYVVCNLSVPLIKDYKKIEKLIQKRINNTISLKEYNESYKDIINECKYKIKCFNANFKELYILNLIYKKVYNKSLELYENVTFDNVLLGILNELKMNIMPVNIFNNIIDMDVSDLLKKFNNDINLCTSDDVDINNKKYIKYIQNKINSFEKIIPKTYSKK